MMNRQEILQNSTCLHNTKVGRGTCVHLRNNSHNTSQIPYITHKGTPAANRQKPTNRLVKIRAPRLVSVNKQ